MSDQTSHSNDDLEPTTGHDSNEIQQLIPIEVVRRGNPLAQLFESWRPQNGTKLALPEEEDPASRIPRKVFCEAVRQNILLVEKALQGRMVIPDFKDFFLILSSNFGGDSPAYTDGNIDLAGPVNFADFLVLSSNFGQTVGATSAVPEPNAHVLTLLGVLAVACVRKSRR